MEISLAIFIRGGLGLLLGLMAGIAGMFGAILVYPGPAPIWAIIIGSGIGAGVAGFFSFLKPESGKTIILITLAIAFIGSFIGAVIGFFYGQVFYPEGVRNVYLVSTGSLRSPPVFAVITGAALLTATAGTLFYSFRLWRYNEV